MALFLGHLLLLACLVAPSWQLQVPPHSGCASLCADSLTSDASNLSTTNGSQIVCNDADYSDTTEGGKFVQCLDCLQNSTYSSNGESDLQSFLYNIRYSFDSCNYGFDKTLTSLSTPCAMTEVCIPLQNALEDGLQDPSNSTQYSYCTADGNAFSGANLESCISCFQETSTASYFANFLIALQGACQLQPQSGELLTLDGTMFSATQIAVVIPTTSTTARSPKSLGIGTIIGIAVACVVVIVIILAVLFVCIRKRRAQNAKNGIKSVADARHGDMGISVPVHGGYISPPAKSPPAYDFITMPEFRSGKEAYSEAAEPVYLGKDNVRSVDQHYQRRQEAARQQQNEYPQDQPQAGTSAQSSPSWPLAAPQYSPQPAYNAPSPRSAASTHTTHSPRSTRSVRSARSTDKILNNVYYGKTSPPIRQPYPSPRDGTASNRSSGTTINTTISDYDPKISPVSVGISSSGMPKENAGTLVRRASSAVRPKVHTRDLSSSRAGFHRDMKPQSAVEISGPIVAITNRFEEDEPRGRTLAGPGEHGRGSGQWDKEMGVQKPGQHEMDSPVSPEEPEQWPGGY
ncbi:hypothetical protein BP6252_01577 [Coleophoma cylindrospora]|uniref:LPXTG-domain-containing protein n=1 Tax=Coleophoma cylindrospora TaxID=1849047 RepID=A0A3D8STC6_9HELO|nr:hypothetical protein BP6252_01577 [Coleophoma cylindrospora]